jgi:NAD(P)H dehydrogenase (quinone)
VKALIVVAHPDPTSFNHAIGKAMQAGFLAEGLDTSLRDLHAEGFDPVLTADEARGAPSRVPLVTDHVEALLEARILGIVHPNCWGAPPAIMKGWMDRVFAPGAAYAFEKESDQGEAPVGLLKARHSLVINTSNTTLQREAETFGDPLQRIWADCLLKYCGVLHVDRRVFRVIASSTKADRELWLEETETAARSIAVKALAG